MAKLGVNIDHVATVRQARKECFPDPVELAKQAVAGGADGITAHLREDRRHIQDRDIERLKNEVSVPLNMEMALAPDIVSVALTVRPTWCCLVPEKREELTTEGGLNLSLNKPKLTETVKSLQSAGIHVSLFIEPDPVVVNLAKEIRADAVELHTGAYARAAQIKTESNEACSGANLSLRNAMDHELSKIVKSAETAREAGLAVNAGHGLDYRNIIPLARAFEFNDYNIGFAIIARSLEVGIESAVAEMKNLIGQKQCVES